VTEIVDELRRMAAVGSEQYVIDERPFWADEDLEEVLEQRISARLLQAPVRLIPTVEGGGKVVSKNGEVEISGTLDPKTVTIIEVNGATIEGVTAHKDGRLEFATDQSFHVPLISGLAYDLNGAAADVLTDWAAAVKDGYDVTLDGQSMSRSQRHSQLLEQAEAFRARSPIGSVRMRRRDVRSRKGGARSLLTAWERLR